MTPTNGTPDPQRLKALVRSIVSTAAPERIILFGSAARGDMHADSDIDLLIIKSNCRTLATAADIYGNLPVGGVPQSRRQVGPQPRTGQRPRPQWLADAHAALDAAVAAAYGRPTDISDDDVLRELLARNGGGA